MTVEGNNNFRYKTLVMVLSVISVVCTVLSLVRRYSIFLVFNNKVITFYLPSLLLTLALIICARILFFIFALKFHSQAKAAVLYPITCGLLAATYLLSGMLGRGIDIVDTVVAISFILLTIGSLKGLVNKAYIIIAAVIGISAIAYSIFSLYTYYYDYYSSLDLIFEFASIIGHIALFAGLLIFGLSNEIPPILKPSLAKQIKQLKEMPPDKALELLNELFNQGKLTEEEYRSQRADIISTI